MSVITIKLDNLAATKRLGIFLGNLLRAGDVIALSGTLGAGKSELARAIIEHHNPDETDIPSPTFTLVQSYETQDGTPLLHFDMYRLEQPQDALELGIEDAFYEGVSLIEWPEKIGPFLPSNALQCDLIIEPSGSRTLVIDASDAWAQRLKGITDL